MKNILLLSITLWTSTQAQNMSQVGFYSITGANTVASMPGYLIVGNGHFVDVADPATPVFKNSIILPANSTSMLKEGNYVYYGSDFNLRVTIADISDINSPSITAVLDIPDGFGMISGMALNGNVLFAVMRDDRIYAIDVSNKANPFIIDSLLISGQARDIAIKGNYAFVAHSQGLKIVDISDPSNMSVIATGNGNNLYSSVTLSNSIAFLGTLTGKVDLYNISTVANPQSLYFIPGVNQIWDVKYKDGLLYVTTGNSELFVYSVSSASASQIAHRGPEPNGNRYTVDLQDSLIYWTGNDNGVFILKIDSLPAGIESAKDHSYFSIYPNPTTSFLTLRIERPFPQNATATIFDLQGNLVKTCSVNFLSSSAIIDVEDLPNGMYCLNFTMGQAATIQKKIVILK